MQTLAQQMAVYNAYHLNPKNKATHFVGVPLIVFALLIPLAWPAIRVGGVSVTAAMVLVAAVSLYYLVLDMPLGLFTALALLSLLWAAHLVAAMGAPTGWTIFALAFAGGWILQLVGHVFEGRRPALVDNLFQVFIAPVFLVAEAAFAFGVRAKLKQEVDALTVR